MSILGEYSDSSFSIWIVAALSSFLAFVSQIYNFKTIYINNLLESLQSMAPWVLSSFYNTPDARRKPNRRDEVKYQIKPLHLIINY